MSKQIPDYGIPASGLDNILDEQDKANETETTELVREKAKLKGRKKKSAQKGTPNDKIKTSLYISSDLQRQLKVFCAESGISITSFLSELIENALRKEINKRRNTE